MEPAALDAVLQLVPWVLAAWALDCLWRVPPGHAVAAAALTGAPRWRGAGWHFTGVTPGAAVVRTWRPPFLLSPAGLFVLGDRAAHGIRLFDRGSYALLEWETLPAPSAEGARLVAGPGLQVECPSPAEAAHWASALDGLRQCGAAEREPAIVAFERARVDVGVLQQELAGLRAPLRLARLGSSAALLGAAALVGVALAGEALAAPARQAVYLLAGATLVAGIVTALLLARALHRAGVPTPPGARVTLCLYPVSVWHAAAALACHRGWRFDWLAVAQALLPAAEHRRLLRLEALGARQASGDASDAAWRAIWTARATAVESLAAAAGIADPLATAPPSDARTVTWCPFCGGEYRLAVATCLDCGAPTERVASEIAK